MNKPKKLIEVAMPVKEISAESVRDKSIRKGHISTLHLWWARRPLPVCRAVVFASLVPDPLDENCPIQFKEAVEILLGKKNDIPGDPYKPYEDIPHTAIVDKMEDNLRNRLMMFIGKFSDKYVRNEKLGKDTAANEQLHQYSLIKWDNKNDDKIIGRARKLIFVSHNACSGKTTNELLEEYEQLNTNIIEAETALYNFPDRHIVTKQVIKLEKAKDDAISAFLTKMPKVFDPFAGGGAIPLEAARLGCNSYGNDINPVAHLIQKGSCEFPQKYGKSIIYDKDEFINIYGISEFKKHQGDGNVFGNKIYISNRLAFDVEYYGNKILSKVKNEIFEMYEKSEDGNEIIMYYWARTAFCSNPTCKYEIPLIKQPYISKKRGHKSSDWKYLVPFEKDGEVYFSIKSGICNQDPIIKRGNLKCPVCKNITPIQIVKKQFKDNKSGLRLIFTLSQTKDGKRTYNEISQIIKSIEGKRISSQIKPSEIMPVRYIQAMPVCSWGYKNWGDIFLERQLNTINKFINEVNLFHTKSEHDRAVLSYLALWINRIIVRNTSFSKWHILQETIEHLYGRQAISMAFDFPEMNPFADFSGNALNQLMSIINVIIEENGSFPSILQNTASGDIIQFNEKEIDVTITDPPYYDAIAYADLSDFFYVWLKRSLSNLQSINLAYPLTPKENECTAIKHHHNNDADLSRKHFEDKLLEIFKSIEHQTNDLVSIMFAHQSTQAWTTLCNSVLQSKMNLVGSWANDTEQIGALKAGKDFLSSSVTVACKPSTKFGIGDYKEVQEEIIKVIKEEVNELYILGFRGADLLTACFGKAVAVFGRYEIVERANGTKVTVAELLEMAREAAFDAIISDIKTDDLTKFYIGWLNLFGFTEAVHDDVRRISQIGLSIEISEIYNEHILIKKGEKGFLGSMEARIKKNFKLGQRSGKNNDIDTAHRMMFLYDPNKGSRAELLEYIAEKAPSAESSAWRVLNSLVELLPKSKEMKDHELASGLLSNQENLLREAKSRQEVKGEQINLNLE